MSREISDVELYAKLYWKRYHKLVPLAVLALVALWLLGAAFYSVQADSEAVVLRFGRYARTTLPGLHLKLPWPVERALEVPVRRIQTVEFGFMTVEAGPTTIYERTVQDEAEALMLTGDLNLAHVEWIVQYLIKDARNYLFKIGGDPDSALAVNEAIRNVSESVMRTLVGDASVDEVITIGREEIAGQAEMKIQEMLDQLEAGVEVVTVKLQAATPPEEVKDAFDEVNRARQNKERVVNEAHGERNRQIPAAKGQRDGAISEAEGYAERVRREATGRANAFLARLAEYEKAPKVTRTRLYIEAMEKILTQVDQKIVIDQSVPGVLPLLDIDRGTFPGREAQGGGR